MLVAFSGTPIFLVFLSMERSGCSRIRPRVHYYKIWFPVDWNPSFLSLSLLCHRSYFGIGWISWITPKQYILAYLFRTFRQFTSSCSTEITPKRVSAILKLVCMTTPKVKHQKCVLVRPCSPELFWHQNCDSVLNT